MLKLNYTYIKLHFLLSFFQTADKMGSNLIEKRIEEIRKRKRKLLHDINLIDDALNGLDELEDFVENFKYKIVNYYNEAVLDGDQ